MTPSYESNPDWLRYRAMGMSEDIAFSLAERLAIRAAEGEDESKARGDIMDEIERMRGAK